MAWRIGERGRKFAREVGSFVLGVLIALGLGAVATEIGWRIEVAEARAAIREELSGNLALARDRGETAPCADRRFDALAAILTTASTTRGLPPLGTISSPGRPGFSSTVWQSFVSAQTVAHFPPGERAALSRLALNVDSFTEIVDADSRAWQTLAMMTGPGRPLDAGTEAALSNARYADERLARSLDWLTGIVRRSGLPAYYLRSDLGVDRAPVRQICEPIPAEIPATYGQSASGHDARFRVNAPARPQ